MDPNTKIFLSVGYDDLDYTAELSSAGAAIRNDDGVFLIDEETTNDDYDGGEVVVELWGWDEID